MLRLVAEVGLSQHLALIIMSPSSHFSAPESMSTLISMDQVIRKVEGDLKQEKLLLDNVSWSLRPGQRVAVLSNRQEVANAFVSCAAGVAPVQGGEVRIDAHVSWPMGESGALLGILTARENAAFLQKIYGSKGRRDHEIKYIQFLADLEDNEFDLPLRSLPKEMTGRFRLALSLCFRFDVYTVPKLTAWDFQSLSVHDYRFQVAFESATANKSLLVSHPDPDFQDTYCNEGIVLDGGRLVFAGNLDECRAWIQQSKALRR